MFSKRRGSVYAQWHQHSPVIAAIQPWLQHGLHTGRLLSGGAFTGAVTTGPS